MLKKLLTLTLVFVGIFALTACDNTPEGPTDLEKIAEALVEIDLPSETATDLTFPSTGLHDVTITWESSNTDVIANDGTVTIPLFTEGNKTVTVTAYVTIGENTLTKEFSVAVNAATVKTDAEKAQEASDALLLADTLVVSDITLVEASLGATVSWASDKPAYLAADGTVTRPVEGESNEVVTLTATITLGDTVLTKTFEITVVAEASSAAYTTIQAIYDNANLNDYVEITGIVIATFDGGYFITDGTHSLGVYHRGIEVEIGDEVHMKGFYAVYNTLYQLSNLSVEEIVSEDNANPLTPVVKTVAEINALDATDKTIHGMPYTVTGILEERTSGSYTNLFLVDGDAAFQIYHYSLEDSLEVLEGLIGREVTITATYYTEYQKTGVVYMAFDGDEDDIALKALEGQAALDSTQLALDGFAVKVTNGDDIVLPTDGGNNVVLSGWTSSDTDVLANDGTFVALDTESVVITFTATATAPAVGTTAEMTQEVTLDVVVAVNSSIEDVLNGDTEEYFQVTGIVYELSYYGAFIEDNGHYIFVYGKDLKDTYVKGDQLIILGKRTMYSGLYQVSAEDIEKGTTGNTLPVAVPSTVSALMNDLVPRGTIATVTGTVEEITVGDYTDVYVTDPSGAKVKVYYRSNVSELDDHIGTVVTLDLVAYQNGTVLYQGMKADAVAATFTAEDKVQIAIDNLMFSDEKLVDDITLDAYYTYPFAEGATVVNFVWSSDTPASISDAGVVTRMQEDVTVTLSVTATLGTVSLTKDFVVVVEQQPLSVTEALLLADDTVVLVEGIIIGEYYSERIIQDPVTGAQLYIDENVDGEIGDLLIVRGKLDTYTSWGNNRREIEAQSFFEVVESTESVFVNPMTDPALIAEEFSGVYTATLKYLGIYDDSNSKEYVWFEGSTNKDLKIHPSYLPDYFEAVYAVNDTLEVTFTIMDVDRDHTRIVNPTWETLNEADSMVAVKAVLDVADSAPEDLELPTEMYGVTIAWASDNAAITAAGVVTRPAIDAGDETVTLTATLTRGALTDTKVFTVTVPELTPPAVPLFISEYIEGSSNNKAIEIYNPNDFDVVMTGYMVALYSNGSSEYGNTLDLSTYTILANDVFVISNSSANATIAAQEDVTSNITWYNGNDAVALLKDDVVVDVIGVIGEDPAGGTWAAGTAGSTGEFTLVRNSSVTVGNTTFTASEWTEYPQNTDTNLGSHTTD
jgi:hypothetical protein